MKRRPREQPTGPVLGLPAELAIGPQIEQWAAPGRACGWEAAVSAWTRWRRALADWAAEVGVPLDEAMALCRTRRPWSRAYLVATGRQDLVDHFEGRT